MSTCYTYCPEGVHAWAGLASPLGTALRTHNENVFISFKSEENSKLLGKKKVLTCNINMFSCIPTQCKINILIYFIGKEIDPWRQKCLGPMKVITWPTSWNSDLNWESSSMFTNLWAVDSQIYCPCSIVYRLNNPWKTI